MILYLTIKIGTLEYLAKQDPSYLLVKELNINTINKFPLGIICLGRIGGSIAKKF